MCPAHLYEHDISVSFLQKTQEWRTNIGVIERSHPSVTFAEDLSMVSRQKSFASGCIFGETIPHTQCLDINVLDEVF